MLWQLVGGRCRPSVHRRLRCVRRGASRRLQCTQSTSRALSMLKACLRRGRRSESTCRVGGGGGRGVGDQHGGRDGQNRDGQGGCEGSFFCLRHVRRGSNLNVTLFAFSNLTIKSSCTGLQSIYVYAKSQLAKVQFFLDILPISAVSSPDH